MSTPRLRLLMRQLGLHVERRRKLKETAAPLFAALKTPAITAAGLSGAAYLCSQMEIFHPESKFVLSAKDQGELPASSAAPSPRAARFREFASVELDGTPYMTPQDFLESVTDDFPRPRIGRLKLRKEDVDNWLDSNTPARNQSSSNMFRKMHNKGIISITEYLFLLCVLTKPRSGFQIAFNMFDMDGNERVDRDEFLVLERIFSTSETGEKVDLWKAKEEGEGGGDGEADEAKEEDAAKEKKVQPTSLLVHLFGTDGKEVLSFEDFHKFMENLQTEVLELEFNEFSRGYETISEEDFARILLRYTHLHASDYDVYIQRLRERVPEEKGISFEDFKQFCQFLNNLDDFSIAMRMYTFADQPISQNEFSRAVLVSTGYRLHPHVVNTVFQIFDDDGDGFLSYREFIFVMKNRVQRGFRQVRGSDGGWDGFTACVRSQLKNG